MCRIPFYGVEIRIFSIEIRWRTHVWYHINRFFEPFAGFFLNILVRAKAAFAEPTINFSFSVPNQKSSGSLECDAHPHRGEEQLEQLEEQLEEKLEEQLEEQLAEQLDARFRIICFT